MRNLKLNKTNVEFNSVLHEYTLNKQKLQGITKVIHERLFPNEYKDVPEAILNKAAERGSRIHNAIELFERCGMPTDNCPELDSYLEEREKDGQDFLLNHRESEYIVTDSEQYASAIDMVYQSSKGFILADIKTTYKLNIEYVSWQLSVYAYLFKLVNPTRKIAGLYAIWLRGDKSKVVQVQQHTEEEVKKLLYTLEPMTATEAPTDFDEKELYELKRKADEAAKAYDEAKAKVLSIMQTNNMQKIDGTFLTITRKADTERQTFDSKRFKEEHTDLYNDYTKTSVAKGGLLIKEK